MNNPRYMRLYSVAGGNELIVRELAARIEAQILFHHQVTDIGRAESGRLRVRAINDEAAVEREFDRVIVALPNIALPLVRYKGDRLAEAMRRHVAHYYHPAHYLRVTILFDRPFWRGAFPDSYCMLEEFGGCCLYDESARHPGRPEGILGWLIAGDAADAMGGWDDDRLISAALDSLPEFVAGGRTHFVEGRVHRWLEAVNAMPGGRSAVPLDVRHRPEPAEHADFFVVGDYLFDSTINGVLDSADYVAQWIASSLNERGE